MAMEYIEGEDLGKLITEKGILPEAEALLYIRQIGDALTVVHDRGLLHRDLKPSNIMMRAGKQEAVLIDFGIARQFIPDAVHEDFDLLFMCYFVIHNHLALAVIALLLSLIYVKGALINYHQMLLRHKYYSVP